MHADLVLQNANIITMDDSHPFAEAVAVVGDKISAIGSAGEIEPLIGPGTKIVDIDGKTALPGFNDAHLHLFSLFRKLLSVDLSPAAVRSIVDIKKVIRKQASRVPPGTWISGTDYNEFYLADKRCPTRRDLDEAAPGHPVILSHRSLHACVLNSLALSLAGIGRETPEPPGARIERDLETGEPNGILIDMLAYVRGRVMPPFSQAELDEAFRSASRLFISQGITSVQDATYRNDLSRWSAVNRCQASGIFYPRVSMMAGPETRFQFQEKGMVTGFGDHRLRLGAVKFLLEVQPDQDQLNVAALECHLSGWQLAFHAVAETTVAAAVTALEYVRSRSPVTGRRHRIEHCGECPPDMLERIKSLDAVIISHPSSLFYSGERYLATIAGDQLPWLYRLKSPLEKKVVVAAASDGPVAPVSPLAGIYGAVTRRAASGQVLSPEERIGPQQALSLYTVNAAYASFEENIKGCIKPGMLADMVVLSDAPLGLPPEKIMDVKVEMTIIGGEVVWEK